MRQFVLRQGLQRGTAATNGTVQVQVSLVLLRALSELHGGGVDHRVQMKHYEESDGENMEIQD